MALARCYACGKDRPVEEFSRDKAKASGRASICRPCDAAKARRYYAANRDKVLARYEPAPPRVVVCAGCRGSFTATNGRQRYCEPSCRPTGDRGATVQAVCLWCDQPFTARVRDRARGAGLFCSKSHASLGRTSPMVQARREAVGA